MTLEVINDLDTKTLIIHVSRFVSVFTGWRARDGQSPRTLDRHLDVAKHDCQGSRAVVSLEAGQADVVESGLRRSGVVVEALELNRRCECMIRAQDNGERASP
jgi:hypothetical protein